MATTWTAQSASAGDLGSLVGAMPFAASLGIELTAAAPGEVSGRLDWHPSRCTVAGVLHGGALMAFGDSLGGICAYLNLPPGAGTSTIESKTNLFRAVRSGTVHGVCRPLHVGRSTIVVQTDVTDDQGRRVAQVTQTQTVRPRDTA
jgi:1,4-dihydroxy-2-naphthoyl-CoA hydrolase